MTPADLACEPEPWMEHGACAGEDPALWFPDRGPAGIAQGKQAKAICAACTQRTPCLEYALRRNERGIWAGTTERDRRRIRRERGLGTPLPPRPEKCCNGHELSDETAIVSYRGGWRCKVCDREYQRRAKRRQRAKLAVIRGGAQ